jgi:hypothetical protein
MLEKVETFLAGLLVSLTANGDEIINKLLDIVKNLLHPIMTFMIALCRVLYPPLIVVGIILWAIGERWLAWRFLSSGLLTAIVVELIIPALGLV